MIENGNIHIKPLIEASEEAFASMNKTLDIIPPPATFQIGFIADQDELSKQGDGRYYSSFARTELYRVVEDGGKVRYYMSYKGEDFVSTEEGSKKGRGGEYSILENYGGKIVTACDKTGNLDEIVKMSANEDSLSSNYAANPIIGANGDRLKILHGDGRKKTKGLKCEWSCRVDGLLFIGSTGREKVKKDGRIDRGAMWVKYLDERFDTITDVDWVDNYNALRKATKCFDNGGYMHHESARYSPIHNKWFFIPRKLSRKPYDENEDDKKCINLMLAVDATSSPSSPSFDARRVIAKSILDYFPFRGCSEFFFLPGSNDTHIFVMRTVETEERVLLSFASVIDLEGNVLMPEFQFAIGRKFEGACILDHEVDNEEVLWC